MALDTDKLDKQLAGMTRADTVAMRDYLTDYLRQTEGEAREQARQAAIELLKAQGFSPSDLFGFNQPQERQKRTYNRRNPNEQREPAEPKYRHPENETLTWSGRGRKPRFIVEHEEAGGNIEDFLINKE